VRGGLSRLRTRFPAGPPAVGRLFPEHPGKAKICLCNLEIPRERSSTAYEREKGRVPLKIISQSADELVLKEGSASGLVAGVAFVIAGVLAWDFLHRSNSIVIWIAPELVAVGIAAILCQFFHHRACQQRERPGFLSEEAIDRSAGLDVQHCRHLSHRDPKAMARAEHASRCESGRFHAAATACSPVGDCFQRRAGTGARSPENFFQYVGRLGGSDGRPGGENHHRGFKWRSFWKCRSRKSRRPTWAWVSILSAETPVV
jgi:hypothetical protein